MNSSDSERGATLMFEPGSVGPRKYFSTAWRFWEPKRAVYNAVLGIFVLSWIVVTWPHFRPAMNWGNLGRLLILAAIGYIVDLLAQQISRPSALWAIRWTTFCVGMALAALLTNYWIADEIYPYMR